MPRRPRTPTVAIAILAAALGAGVIAGGGTWNGGDPAPGARIAKQRAPGAEPEAVGISPDAPTEVSDPMVVRPRMAQFDGDLRDLPAVAPKPRRQEGPEAIRADAASPSGAVVRPEPRPPIRGVAPAGSTFDGLKLSDRHADWPDGQSIGTGYPPDTNIDVGPTYVIETVNTGFAVYRKDTHERVAFDSMDALFAGTGTACDNSNQGDPIVLYDTIADRWIISDFAWADIANGPFYECLAVSKTGDPITGDWYFYAYELGQNPASAPASRAYMPDYPKLGIWPNGIYMSVNLFWRGNRFSNGRLVAFNRTQLEAGVRAAAVVIDLTADDSSLLPSNARVQTGLPPDGRPAYFTSFAVTDCCYDTGNLTVRAMHVDWSDPGASTVDAPVTVAAKLPWNIAPAKVPSPGNDVDTLSDRLMMQTQYTAIGGRESIWLSHNAGTTADASSTAFPMWHQLDVTGGTIDTDAVQSGMLAPDATLHRFIPSIAVDRLGDAAMAYSVSNATTDPGIRYAGRLASDGLGEFGYGERTLKDGDGSQTVSDYSRWGDYASMTLDPSDGCTFWFASEYYGAIGDDWRTAISSFSYPSCTGTLSAVALPEVSIPPGTPVAGSTATTTNGSWNVTPDSYAYSWQRYEGGAWTTILRADGASHDLVDADLGTAIRSVVTATSSEGSGTTTSAAFGLPSEAVAIPATGAVGDLVEATPGTWGIAGSARAYVWKRDGAPIDGADGSTYRLTADDAGAAITVAETVDAVLTSTSQTLQVAPYAVTRPTIDVRGGTLAVASSGGWAGASGATTAYRWVRGPAPGTAIAGATGVTYAVTEADRGASICLRVTRAKGGATASSTSACKSPSFAITAVAVARPTRTGLARGLRVAFTAGQSATVRIVVKAGRQTVGTRTASVEYGTRSLVVPIDAAWRRRARSGAVLRIAVSGTTATAVALTPGAATTRVRAPTARTARFAPASIR